MNDTDMILIDPDPKDPFDFYLDHYMEELSAGYTFEITPQDGLRVYMVDFNKLKHTANKIPFDGEKVGHNLTYPQCGTPPKKAGRASPAPRLNAASKRK